jgi:hypothetical protein
MHIGKNLVWAGIVLMVITAAIHLVDAPDAFPEWYNSNFRILSITNIPPFEFSFLSSNGSFPMLEMVCVV